MGTSPLHLQASAYPSQRRTCSEHEFRPRADRIMLDTSVLVGKSTLVRDWAELLHRELHGVVRAAGTHLQAI